MRFTVRKLLIFVTLVALACAAPSCWKKIQLQRFKTYVDQDLQSLSGAELNKFRSIANSVLYRPDRSEEPSLLPLPCFLSRLPDGNLILVERSLASPIPGHSLVMVSVMKDGGKVLTQTEFPTGWRIRVINAQPITSNAPNEFLFVINSETATAGRDVAKHFYAIINNYPCLLRLEDSLGYPVPNETGHFKIGPESPEEVDRALVRKRRFALVTQLRNSRNGGKPAIVFESAESVLRKFLMAKAMGDLNALRRFSIDHPELAVLQNKYLTGSAFNRLAKMSSSIPIKELVVGDSIVLPNGKTIEVSDSMANEQRKLFVANNASDPFAAHLIDGRWKIDPAPSIAAQKALEE